MQRRICFDHFEVQPLERVLLQDGQPVRLGARAFDLLLALVQHPGQLLTKDELLDMAWPGLVVEEANIQVQISALRKIIGAQAIATIPGLGYRFCAMPTDSAPARSPNGQAAFEPFVLPDRPSIAVLPFANLSGEAEQEYFVDGMVDDILVELSHVRWLLVIARHSSFVYKYRIADVQEVGRQLGVRYVVDGSVRKSGTRVRINAQLIETESGAHLWAERYDGPLNDIFVMQDDISSRVVAAVEDSVRDAEIRRITGKRTESLSAYDLYLRALPAWFGQGRADYLRAQSLLGEALEADPTYAEAAGTLSDSVSNQTLQGWSESWAVGVKESERLADRAVSVGPDNSTCLASAAFTHGALSNRYDEAVSLADRAVRVHPNSVFVCNRVAAVYTTCGDSDKAIAHCAAACRMNPLDSKKAATTTYSVLSAALYMARRYEESIRAGRRALGFAPHLSIARKYVATSLAQLGHTDEARKEMAELLKHQPAASLELFQLQPFRHRWMRELHAEGLRKAGLR